MIVHNTNIEPHFHKKHLYFVKREDMACALPGPPSAKMRGLSVFMKKLQQNGILEVGYMDTAISMAGWGVAYFAKKTNIQAVLYYPKYKDGYRYNQEEYIAKWGLFGARIMSLKYPTQHQININRAKRDFFSKYPKGVWLPNGLKFEETIQAVSKEIELTLKQIQPATIICNVGSGVMFAGILLGLYYAKYKINTIIGITDHSQMDVYKKKNEILKMIHFEQETTHQEPLFAVYPRVKDVAKHIQIISGKYLYHEMTKEEAPFPCNPYYDLKALEFLKSNIVKLPKPILFWNIGA